MNLQNNEGIRKIMQFEDVRCDCGSLIAKLNSTYIEMKCRRCKRILKLALDELKEHGCTTHLLANVSKKISLKN